MNKDNIITVMKAALELLKIEDALPEDFNTDAQSDIVSAQSALIGDLFADVEVCRTVLDALRTTAPAVDQAQIRELIEENGRLKREFEASQERVAQLAGQLEEARKQIADLKKGDEPKKRAPGHKWTTEENRWIADHLNSTTDIEVSKKFGVSRQAAMSQMHRVRAQLGK